MLGQTTQILNRIKLARGIKTDAQLARELGVPHQSIIQARQKNSVPSSWIFILSEKFGLSPTWLVYGLGPMRLDELTANQDSEREELLAEIRSLFEARYPGHTITQHTFKD